MPTHSIQSPYSCTGLYQYPACGFVAVLGNDMERGGLVLRGIYIGEGGGEEGVLYEGRGITRTRQ